MAETVMEEIHQTRRAISDRFRGDIAAIAADAEARQAESGHPVWNPETPNKRATSDRAWLAGATAPPSQRAAEWAKPYAYVLGPSARMAGD